ncbi:MAG: flavin reductase family protein [Lachnospiraceae bacterium]|nr:flavin reductase family protein [Lachnospiraceae bacterium]
MGKVDFKPGNMLYPLPAVMVSVSDGKGKDNILTVAWVGTVCSDPAMVSISVRKSRYSYDWIIKTGEFVINLTTEELAWATDYCGVVSGRDVNKWEKCGLHKIPGTVVNVPYIEESPVAIECKVRSITELGTHDMFLAEIVAVHADDRYMDEKGTFHLEKAHPLVYSHGRYYSMGEELGKFGYSIKKQ